MEMTQNFIVPLAKRLGDTRCVHSKKIQRLLTQLDNQEMISLLTLFHRQVVDIYRAYADGKGCMNFNQFIVFCSDYDVFPDLLTKAALFRIFHSLSFINEILSNGKGGMSKSVISRATTAKGSVSVQ